jgi:hypothetical protein
MRALSALLDTSVRLLASADHGHVQPVQSATPQAYECPRRCARRAITVGRELRLKIGIQRRYTSPYRARKQRTAWVGSRTMSQMKRTTHLPSRVLMVSTASRHQRLHLAPADVLLDSSARRALLTPSPRQLGTSARVRGMRWLPHACPGLGQSTIPGTALTNALSVQGGTHARQRGPSTHGHAFPVHTGSSTKLWHVSSATKAAGTPFMPIH